MASKDFFNSITTVFNNREIKSDIKYDIVCRLICESFEASCVTMLLYNAERDTLISRGNYLSSQKNRLFETGNNDLKNIISYIEVFELFESISLESVELVMFNDLIDSVFWGKVIGREIIDNDLFNRLREQWLDSSIRSLYFEYKKCLHSEHYDINRNTVSGCFFSDILSNGDKHGDKIMVFNVDIDEIGSAFYLSLADSSGIKLRNIKFYCIELPLFEKERCTGVLRIIMSADNSIFYEAVDLLEEPSSYFKERLNNYAKLISLHLETEYYLEGYLLLSNLGMNIAQKNGDVEELKNICNVLLKTINCNGCMIKLNKNLIGLDVYSEVVSDTLASHYSDKPQQLIVDDIVYRMLDSKNGFGYKIRAVSFYIRPIDVFVTNEYYYDKSNNLKLEQVVGRRFEPFTPESTNALIKLNIHEILILAIGDNDGLIVLTNTVNRKFTISDVNMILLASKRIQGEIKMLQDLRDKTRIELHESQMQGMNIVMHQFGQIIKSSIDTIAEINDRSEEYIKNQFGNDKNVPQEYNKIVLNIKLLSFLMIHSQGQLKRTESFKKIDIEPIKPNKKAIYDFHAFILNKCKDFEPYANVERGLHIRLITPREIQRVDADPELLAEVIYNLLDNAVKYSFDSEEMRAKGVNYDKNYYRSEGNILVAYEIQLVKICISITNWGITINPAEKEFVFERFKRGSNAKNVIGTGIGLFLCKKLIEAQNGSIFLETGKNKTTFIITLNR